ncbi:hypothetical protein BU25DRAFT_463286 [Macroventuria anomochaeta]|uniref:Uncharacterized protein n=1 Tax=Macroventuria anomochaeta TaxID=301207 RepID=A0ACB6RKR4_9PLEO|nr:uncharacterized protein BU25DRAFT_463286 [Macroventuria anomochaeta]KAF2622000.1 hypothetical protein BU25DRAFT_463286 [Macroventuria anomochaeta]
MLVKTIIAVAAMAGSALAGFDIKTGQTEWWYTDDAESTSIVNALSKAIDSYEAALETQADVKSAQGAFYTYARTRDGIPDIVTATGTSYTQYTTLPDWYTAMPADALKVFESVRKEEDKIWSSVVPKAARTSGSQGAAPQVTGMGVYAHGAIAAVVGAVAVAL